MLSLSVSAGCGNGVHNIQRFGRPQTCFRQQTAAGKGAFVGDECRFDAAANL